MTAPVPTGHLWAHDEPDDLRIDLFTPDPDSEETPPPPVYDFVQDGLTPGAWVLRRQIAESAYYDDAIQVQVSRAMSQAQWGFFVTGRNPNNLESNIRDLLAIIKRPRWHLHVRFDGGDAHWAWENWSGEPTVGFTVAAWYGIYAPVTVSCPRKSKPIAGPY